MDSDRNALKTGIPGETRSPESVPRAESEILDGLAGPQDRNWVPLTVAAVLIIAVVVAGLVLSGHPRNAPAITPITASLDAYAESLPVTNLSMSEPSNLAGGKVVYVDGHLADTGTRTVTGITVQVLFHGFTAPVAQNETMPLRLIRMREPYIDTESVGADPLKPGDQRDFRLIFDKISADWAGAAPEIRIIHTDVK